MFNYRLSIFEIPLEYFHIFIVDDLSKPMSQKVFLIPFIIFLASGVVAIVVLITKEKNLAPLDKEGTSSERSNLDWKVWRSSDYGPGCDSDPNCYEPLSYNMGIEFRYPPEFTFLGYRDKGGGLWFSYTNPDNSTDGLAIDCTTTTENELVEWLLPRAFEYYKYTLLDAKNIAIEEYQGTEAIFEVTPTIPQAGLRKFKDRLIRFSIKNQMKVCEIQAPIELDCNLVELMISSFKVSSQEGVIE